MKTLRLYIFLPVVLSSFFIQGQSFQLQQADRYFENTYYSKAIPLYEEILKYENKPEVLLNLADAYYFTFQVQKAARNYGFLLKNHPEKISQQQIFQYIQTLKALGNVSEANAVFEQHFVSNEKEKEAFHNELRYLENIRAIGNRFEIKNLPLNTENSEFGGTFFQGQFVFSATNTRSGLFSKVFYWNNEPYLNLYTVPVSDINTVAEKKLFSEKLSTRFHESNAVFSPDGKTVYFTRNNYLHGSKKRDENKVTQLQIYKAEFIDGEWGNTTSLPINSDAFSNEHPALSPDGKTLYFASNRPGGYGNFDLYKVNTLNFENTENLGPEINTSQREQFPFIDAEGNLYFASDGHPGFGHLDIFISKPSENGRFEKPDNVGLPVNSGYDDFAFYIDTETKTGYFSSNRITGKGSDDIYRFTEILPLIIEDCYQLISGTVIDKTSGELLPESKVVLMEGNRIAESLTTGADAYFQFKVYCNESYKILGSKMNYQGDSLNIVTSNNRKQEHKVVLKLMSFEEKIRLEEEKARDEKDEIEARLKAEKEALTLQKQQEKKIREAYIKRIVETERDIVKEDDRYLIKTEPIYFDYDLWYIRQESRVVLERVIDLLKKYPQMTLEIGTHTDIRGTKKYNQELSEKRSASVVDYFESQGIDSKRIIPKGYGKEHPIIHCETEESCTEEQHEINRRCEFVIIGFD